MGPPGVGVLGAAAYANVPTRPTNRSSALTERFIDFLLRVDKGLLEDVSPEVRELNQIP